MARYTSQVLKILPPSHLNNLKSLKWCYAPYIIIYVYVMHAHAHPVPRSHRRAAPSPLLLSWLGSLRPRWLRPLP